MSGLVGGGMLQGMQQSGQAQPSSNSSSFAGLLATLATPRAEPANSAPLWSNGDLGEDVATLSYEQALRTHARYRPADREKWAAADAGGLQHDGADTEKARAAKAGDGRAAKASGDAGAGHDGELRRSSVTVRLSKDELEQLRQRAAEAGLTISAYLRSCTFEAEALRAQVKEALAELRKAGAEGTAGTGNRGPREQGNEEEKRGRYFGWVARFVALRRRENHAARAESVGLQHQAL